MSSEVETKDNSHCTWITGLIIPRRCTHLAEFHARNGANPFRALQDCIRIKAPEGRAAIHGNESEVPRCSVCFASARPRLYACLACAAVSCESHAAAHARAVAPGHEIAVDVDRAELFCCVCCDQVYDRDFDAAVVLAQPSAMSASASLMADEHSPGSLRKRRKVDHRPWSPDLEEHALMTTTSSDIHGGVGESSVHPVGLRGLNNLGNTCFMNSVLQALLHTPPMRNYFLGGKHNRYYCQQNFGVKTRSGGGGVGGNDAKSSQMCLACDLGAIFLAVYSGDRKPYSPAKFLYSWWRHAANLASYQQQDAHEFFISMLDAIHDSVEKDHKKPLNPGSGDCCIAHRVFSGILRSDVMCTVCGFTSTTYDPCIDISLDLEPIETRPSKPSSFKFHSSCNSESDCMDTRQNTLMGCLDRFTRPEKLGSDQKFFCQKCQERQESLKQMSLRKLPLVSCFHIKRFEHSSVRKMSKKVDHFLHFPFSLDMAPYLSSSILRSRFGNRIYPFDGDDNTDACNEVSTELELFAVITHTGKIDAGHYVTYLRLSNQWYRCDDAWITQVNENIVRAAQGYMMFYVQKMLYRKASERSC